MGKTFVPDDIVDALGASLNAGWSSGGRGGGTSLESKNDPPCFGSVVDCTGVRIPKVFGDGRILSLAKLPDEILSRE